MGEQNVEAVYGLAQFVQGMDGERWTKAEMAPIVAVMREANEGARRRFGIIASEPKGLGVGWTFMKANGDFGPRYLAWLNTWRMGSVGQDTPDAIAATLREHYAWYLEAPTIAH